MAKEPDPNFGSLEQVIDNPSFIASFNQTFPSAEQAVSLDDVFEILGKHHDQAEADVRKTLVSRTTLALSTQQSHFIASEQPNLLKQTRFVSEFANSLLHRVVISNEILSMDEWYVGGPMWEEAQVIDLIGQHVLRPMSPLIGAASVVWPGRQSDDVWEIDDAFINEIHSRQKDKNDWDEYWQVHDKICVERTQMYSNTDWQRIVRAQLNLIRQFLYDRLSKYSKFNNSVTDLQADVESPLKAMLDRYARLAIFYGDYAKIKNPTTELEALIKKHYGEEATLMNLLQDMLPVNFNLDPAQPTGAGLSSEPRGEQ